MILEGASIFALVVAAFVVITALMGVRQVPQGYNYTVERFGRYYKTLTPGLGLIVPYIDFIGRKLNVMEQVMDVPSQEIITRDNATVTVDGVAFYQVLDARRAAYEISDLELALRNIVMTNVRTVMGSMDLDQLLSHRDEINARLLTVIDAASEPWGIKVTRVEIKDIVPPKNLVEAMGRQMKAEREKRAVILEAEGMRQSDITRAEGRKAALVLEAEGRRDAAFRAAEAVERTAQAGAMATRVISEATASGDVVAVNFLIAEKYIAALHAFAQSPNQKLVIVPMELSSLAGTLGGLSQIAASAMGAETVRCAAAPCPAASLGACAERGRDEHADHFPLARFRERAADWRFFLRGKRSEHDGRPSATGPSRLADLARRRARSQRDRDACARRVLHLVRRRGGDCRSCRLRPADGLRRTAHSVRRFGGSAGSYRATDLRVVRQRAGAAAPKPRACDGRRRLLPGRSDHREATGASVSATVRGASRDRIAPRAPW